MELDGGVTFVVDVVGGGMGTATCQPAFDLGATVVGLGRSAEALSEVESGLVRHGTYIPVVGDTLDRRAVAQTRAPAPAAVDGLFNVVGGTERRHSSYLMYVGLRDWNDVVRRNLGCVLPVTHVSPMNWSRWDWAGRSSTYLVSPGCNLLRYTRLSGRRRRRSFIPRGRRPSSGAPWVFGATPVAPGTVQVPKSVAPPDMALRERRIPLQRHGRPEEIADAVVFLLCDAASYVTGQTLVAAGDLSDRPGPLDDGQALLFLVDPAIRSGLCQAPADGR